MAKAKSEGPTFEELEESFRKKKFDPVYFFFGEEDFLIDESVDLMMKEAVDEASRSFNLDVLYGTDIDAKQVVSTAASFPMMGERRVVIVREFDKLPNKELLLPYVANPSPSTCLALIASSPDFRQKVYKTIKEQSKAVGFRRLYDNEIQVWIGKRITTLGKKAAPEACHLLQSLVGNSLREIQNEIEKLLIYIGERKNITLDDVNAVVGMSKEHNIFELQKYLGQRNLSKSLEIAMRMLDSGENLVGMIVMLTRYFQKVWLVPGLRREASSDFQLAPALGVSPYFVKEYVAAAQAFDETSIHDCFDALLEADTTLKSTSTDPKLILTLLIHRFLRQPGIA